MEDFLEATFVAWIPTNDYSDWSFVTVQLVPVISDRD